MAAVAAAVLNPSLDYAPGARTYCCCFFTFFFDACTCLCNCRRCRFSLGDFGFSRGESRLAPVGFALPRQLPRQLEKKQKMA
jgi:hypothetical protein